MRFLTSLFTLLPCALLAGVLSVTWQTTGLAESKGKLRVYVGTYTSAKSKGIYRFDLDLGTGKATKAEVAGETPNPSFLAIHPTQKFLYAANEIGNFEGKKTGAVSAFAIDPATGNLALLNQQESGGSGPCHLVVDHRGVAVLVANYGGGSVESLTINNDGKLSPPVSQIKHEGSSVNMQRQKEPHAHSINLDVRNSYAVSADLGLDKLLVYRFDASKGTLTPNDPPFAAVAPGSGPRHFAFHPSEKFGYVINELSNTITAFAYDFQNGKLTEIQSISTLPAGFMGRSNTAEIVVHPTGRLLYGSNRGHDSIAIYSIDITTGKLTAVGHHPTGGKTPRNFAIDPTGAYLLAENQGSDTIHLFKINQSTGLLSATDTVVEVPSPVCARFLRLE